MVGRNIKVINMEYNNKSNNSEKLAKLLGIEPKKQTEYIPNEIKTIDIYPDFAKPSNFVKLLQLTINNRFNFDINGDSSNPNKNGVYGYVCDKLICAENIEEYLIKMLIQLSKYEDSIKEFKHQAQQIEWEY